MFGLYNKLKNLILSYLFPIPKKTKEDRLIRVIGEYLKFISEVPFDDFNIKLHDKESKAFSKSINKSSPGKLYSSA